MSQRKYKEQYKRLITRLRMVFNEADPMGLVSLGSPEDEYDLEIQAVLARRSLLTNVDSTKKVMRSVFEEMFGHLEKSELVLLESLAVLVYKEVSKELKLKPKESNG